jgi:hypothetical protein
MATDKQTTDSNKSHGHEPQKKKSQSQITHRHGTKYQISTRQATTTAALRQTGTGSRGRRITGRHLGSEENAAHLLDTLLRRQLRRRRGGRPLAGVDPGHGAQPVGAAPVARSPAPAPQPRRIN